MFIKCVYTCPRFLWSSHYISLFLYNHFTQWHVDPITFSLYLQLGEPRVSLGSFWSTSFLCLSERFVVANFWRAGSSSEEINNSFTSVGWYGANVRMLYLHTQRFPSDLLFGLFNKQFDSFSTGLIFCGQAAKPDLISFCVMQYIYFNPKPST